MERKMILFIKYCQDISLLHKSNKITKEILQSVEFGKQVVNFSELSNIII